MFSHNETLIVMLGSQKIRFFQSVKFFIINGMPHFTGSHVGKKGGNSTGEYIDISMLFVAFSRTSWDFCCQNILKQWIASKARSD